MKGCDKWGYRPYQPADSIRKEPYICRLAPGADDCELEWTGEGEAFTLQYAKRGSGQWKQEKTTGKQYMLGALDAGAEYEVKVTDERGRSSRARLFLTGKNVGTVINYLHPEDEQYGFSGQYLCSPSILKLPDGSLLASMDVFKADAPQNLTLLFRSEDEGCHWHYVTDIFPCFWGKLFWHQGKLFLLGVSREYGDLLIGYSEDRGDTWSAPTVILRGSSCSGEDGNHRAPTVILKSHGRLWTGTEYGSWRRRHFAASLLSIDENEDPMVAENWRLTDFVHPSPDWKGTESGNPGGIEGNAVETPSGRVWDILRYSEKKALILEADPEEPEASLRFVEVADFPLGHTKFEISRSASGTYYALGNTSPGRTVLALYASEDLKIWKKVTDVICHAECSINEVGFQYPVFVLDGEHMLLLSRTAWNHAHNFHDSNAITFHRVTIEK
ncbi:MAG: sialidase family protein [Eubacteriales bacterium]|nr:sialidase family protein [Eubacteriales bacterium]